MSSKLGLFVLVFILSISFAYGARMYCEIEAPSGAEVCSEYVTMNLSSTSLNTRCNCFISSCSENGAYIGISYSNDLTYWNQGVNTSNAFHSTTHEHLVSINPSAVTIGYGIDQEGGTDADAMDDPTDIACCPSNLNCSADGKCYRDNRANGTVPKRYYCNDSRWYGGDTNVDICNTVTGTTGVWNIGGIPNCCGDDSNEYTLTRRCLTGSGCTSSLADNACCSLATDCVYSSTCYHETSYMVAPWNPASWVSCSANRWAFVDISSIICVDEASIDSDGGDVPSVGGTVTDYGSGAAPCPETQYADSCIDTETLTEYYPDALSHLSKTYTCADFEVAAIDAGDDPSVTNACTSGTGASCAANAFSTMAGSGGTDSCTGVCGTGVNSCQFREYNAADSADSCPGLDSCAPKLYDADTNSNTCNECKGPGNWMLGGKISSNCCGDDSSEYPVLEVGGADASPIYSDGTANICCDSDTDCNFDDICFDDNTNSSNGIPNAASCIEGIWYGGDASEQSCSLIVGAGRWNLGNGDSADPSTCCGDDNNEYYLSRTGPDYVACCDTFNDWVDTDGSCQPDILLPTDTYIHGYVWDELGGAIKDATVKVMPGSTDNIGDTSLADDTGYYQLFVNSGTFYLMASAPTGFTANFSGSVFVNPSAQVSVNFTLRPTSLSCEDDCTYNEDSICHSACQGINECSFYDDISMQKCDNRGAGFNVVYDANRDVVCCEGTPYIRTNARILSYDTPNKVRQVRVVMLGGKLVQMIVDVFRSG